MDSRVSRRAFDAADGAVDSWIESVATLHAGGAAKAVARDHVRYVVDLQEHYYVPRFSINAYLVPVLKNGTHGPARRYELNNLATASGKHAAPVDRTIGKLIAASGLVGGLGGASPVILGTLLDVMIRTRRMHWHDLHSPALELQPLADARLAWRLDDDNRQRLHVIGHPDSMLVSSTPLWYIDAEHLVAGPLQTKVPDDVSALLAQAPSLTDDQAKRVLVALRHVFSSSDVEAPHVEEQIDVIDRDPTPRVRLTSDHGMPRVDLQFAYGGDLVHQHDRIREFEVPTTNGAAVWPRRTAFETTVATRLGDMNLENTDDERGWIRFIAHTAPRLRAEGWDVEVDDDFPYTVVEADDETWHAQLTEAESRWFELDLGIDINGERVPLLPLLIEALAENGIGSDEDLTALAERSEPVYAKLRSGAYVALPAARVARVLATLVDLFDDRSPLTREGRLPVSAAQAAAIAELERTLHRPLLGTTPLRDLMDALTVLDGESLALPQTFGATLRPYQRDGVAWLQALREHGFGGVLADDMGLGKTVQLLAHLAIEKDAGRLRAPVIILAPTSVIPNWRSEIARFTPHLRVVSLTGPDRATRVHEIDDADIVLTTYALLPRDEEFLLNRAWSLAVLDEAQAIKNPRSKAALSATRLRAEQRIALTGTPIENHLEELWSIFAFAEPRLLGERARFRRLFRTPIEKRNDTLRRGALGARLRPFLLRRTKELVERDLPPKTEIVQRVELSGAQRDLYETIRLAMHARVRDEIERRGLARSRIVVLDALLKLRQICCDPRLLQLQAAAQVHDSAKLDALLDMLESLIEDGRRILLFSQFTSMLDLIKRELVKRHVAFVELRGETRDRETPVKRFQNREIPLFLISLKAGGTGLNLTAADTVIHYDPWWNPAVERQATDRAHRIGQEQHVFVYKIIAEGTVEERILELQERKGALASGLFDDASAAPLKLEMDDIEGLFR